MLEDWSKFIKQYRVRHGLKQTHLATILGVSPSAVSVWERKQDIPAAYLQRQLRDLATHPDTLLSWKLFASIKHCSLARALSRTQNLRLLALSAPAIEKRPSVKEWLGCDLAKIACGVLQEMLDNRLLQNATAKGEIFCVMAVTKSVLQTAEHPRIGTYRTTISYFFHEGTLYDDAISVPVPADTPCGYRAIAMDDTIVPGSSLPAVAGQQSPAMAACNS
jgi:transcriptional regulator with XRE-family HTH domain